MLYIFDKTISDLKNISYALIKLYGINIFQSKKICKKIGINPSTTIRKLNKNQLNKLINYIKKNIKIEQELIQIKKRKNQYLLDMKHNRGIRHVLGLPVNGQRTHTNSKTSKKLKNNGFN